MSNGNPSGHDRQTGTISPVLRPLTWSAFLTATVAAAFATPAFATPAYAEPSLPDAIPDTGARPVTAGAFQLPGVGPATVQPARPAPALANNPLAVAVNAKEVEVASLGDQLLQLRDELTAATANLAAAESRLQAAHEALAQAEATAEAMATTALKDAAALPPGTYGTTLHGLSGLSLVAPDQGPADVAGAAQDLARAKAEEDAAGEEVRALQATAGEVQARFTQLQAQHRTAEASLLKLRRDNAPALQLIERLQEAYEQQLGANFVGSGSRAGMTAHPNAILAVQYALGQLGDPYVWGAEGPNSFDCSGLMWAAYRSAGYYQLPRVSRDQFKWTSDRLVSRYDLLPGDLIFFASGADWTSIHHVGMYIGDGRMVHAPRTGDVVKIATVWWSRFYAATRIFGEVPAPGLPPIVARPPAIVPPVSSGSAAPVGTPTPTPSRTATPSPTAPPSGTPTPDPTSPSPDPTSPSPDPTSPSPEPTSPSPEPTSSPTPEPTDTTSPGPTGSSGSLDGSSEPTPSGETSSPAASTEASTAPTTTASSLASTGGS
jgi:peptidoglycan DL-endopeptidase CwlO